MGAGDLGSMGVRELGNLGVRPEQFKSRGVSPQPACPPTPKHFSCAGYAIKG